MKNQFTNKLLFLVFLFLFCFAGAFVGSAQAQLKEDRVIVDGNPALKQSHVDKLQDFIEWLFETKFSKAQKSEFQRLVVQKWQAGEKESTGILDILKTHDGIQALSEGDRADVRRELLPKVLDSFRNGGSDINKFLSGVYENRRENSVTADGNAIENGGGGNSANLADFAGTWSSGNVSGIRYKNLTNGDLSDVSGNMSEYIISKNGDIQYTGFLSTTIYACSTRLFFTKKGKISVSGSFITFDYKTGERDYQNSCNASLSGVKPIPPQKKTVPFTLERTAQGVKLCTTDEGVQTCLHKVN
ncbi:MAG TPA: hypothetical protein VF599_00010 [Pyrinomonadaceae bacterium]|jgi:hypothetical protein